MDYSSPKVWTELKPNASPISQMSEQKELAEDKVEDKDQVVIESLNTFGGQLLPQLHCLESGDGSDYSLTAVLQTDSAKRQYCPSTESRQLHNHKERLRRSRMKCSCDALRALVPGLTDKTDKATVLEHTVAFLFHLSKCPGVKCDDYLPSYPPPMSAKLLELYPTLMSGEYQYYESIPSTETEFSGAVNQSQIIEVHESNGTQYVITSDGSQYMVVTNKTEATDCGQTAEQSIGGEVPPKEEPTEGDPIGPTEDHPIEQTEDHPIGPTEDCRKCVAEVLDLLNDNKENTDPNAAIVEKQVRQKRAYRKRIKKEDDIPSKVTTDDSKSVRKQRKLRNKPQIN